jgi:hypothetical protein
MQDGLNARIGRAVDKDVQAMQATGKARALKMF